jgi:hypothetical protein
VPAVSRAAGRLRAGFIGGALAASLLASTPSRAAGDDVSQCIAATESSLALRKEGHLQEARTRLVTCARPACPAEIRVECERRLVELGAVQPSIVLAARDDAGGDLVDVHVTLDGAPFVSKLGTAALPVDPGTHELRFEADGREGVSRTVIVREGEKARVIQVVLVRPGSAPRSEGPGEGAGATQRTVGWVVGGAGVVGLGVGSVFGLMAARQWSTTKDECTASSCPNRSSAMDDRDRALSLATVSTIALIFGGVATATGAVLVLTAPNAHAGTKTGAASLSLSPMLGPSLGGLTLRGAL